MQYALKHYTETILSADESVLKTNKLQKLEVYPFFPPMWNI